MKDSFDFTSAIVYYSCYANDYYDENTQKMCIRLDKNELEHILQTAYDLYDDNKLINIGNVKEYIENNMNDIITKYNHNSYYHSRMWIDNVSVIKLEEDTDLEELEMKYNEPIFDLLQEIYDCYFYNDIEDEDDEEIDKFIFVILFEISVLPKGEPFAIIKGVN